MGEINANPLFNGNAPHPAPTKSMAHPAPRPQNLIAMLSRLSPPNPPISMLGGRRPHGDRIASSAHEINIEIRGGGAGVLGGRGLEEEGLQGHSPNIEIVGRAPPPETLGKSDLRLFLPSMDPTWGRLPRPKAPTRKSIPSVRMSVGSAFESAERSQTRHFN